MLALVAAAWTVGETMAAVPPASNGGVPARAGALLDFDIPAQPLAAALNRYAAMTGLPAVFRSSLVSGRISSPLHGAHTPEAALHLLLRGTGLVAADVGGPQTPTFVLKRDSAGSPGTADAPAPADGASVYDGLVQAAVWRGLCANPQTEPGSYRALLRFQVNADGAIRHAQLIGSTGDKVRDAAVLSALHRTTVDRPPPAGLEQPLLMLVLSRDVIVGRACEQVPGS